MRVKLNWMGFNGRWSALSCVEKSNNTKSVFNMQSSLNSIALSLPCIWKNWVEMGLLRKSDECAQYVKQGFWIAVIDELHVHTLLTRLWISIYNVEFIILEFEMKIETDIVFSKLLLLYFFRTYLSVIQNIQQGCSLCEEKSFSNLLKMISDVNSLLETSPISLCNIPKGIDDRWWMFIDFDTSLWLSKGWIMFSKFSSLKMSSGFTRVVNMTHGKWIILRFQNRKSMMIRCKKVFFLYSHSLALCWWQFRISKTQCQRPAIAH